MKLYQYSPEEIDRSVTSMTDQQCKESILSALHALTQLHRRLKLLDESPQTKWEKLGQMLHTLLAFGLTMSDLFGHRDDFMDLSQVCWDTYYGAQEEAFLLATAIRRWR